MSDFKPKRILREPAQGEAAADAAAVAVPVIAPTPAPREPESPTSDMPCEPDRAGFPGREQAATDDPFTAAAEAQAALARGFEQIAAEMAGMTRSGTAAATDAAIALLGAKTLAEAVEINAGLARRGFEAMLEGSAKMSEIAAKSLADASRPILSGFRSATGG